jgi:hypothetical protein
MPGKAERTWIITGDRPTEPVAGEVVGVIEQFVLPAMQTHISRGQECLTRSHAFASWAAIRDRSAQVTFPNAGPWRRAVPRRYDRRRDHSRASVDLL